MKPLPLTFFADALRRRDTVLRRLTLLRDAVARRAGLRLRLVDFLRFAGDLRLRLVDFLRVVLRLAGDLRLRLVDFLRVVLRLAGALRRVVDFLRREVALRFGAALRRVVRRREVALRFGAAFLRVVVFLRVVLLRAAGARRRDVDLRAVVFLRFVVVVLRLAIVFPPVLERALAFRLLVPLRLAAFDLAARLLAGLRGFKITTSDSGMVLKPAQRRLGYKGVVGLYAGVIQNSHNAVGTPISMGGVL